MLRVINLDNFGPALRFDSLTQRTLDIKQV
jgi:hypothetical protein